MVRIPVIAAAAFALTVAASGEAFAAPDPVRLPLRADAGVLSSQPESPSILAAAKKPPLTQEEKQTRLRQSRAFWQSLLVPGLGQLAMGRKTAGYAFLSTEAALVGGLLGLRIYAARIEDDYRLYAFQHAGISTDREHQLYVDAGNWLNERLYNEARLRDRDFEALYTDPRDRWQWDNDDNRAFFKEMRLDSDMARNRAVMVVGGLLLNHLFSAIEAAGGSAKQASLSYSPLPDGKGGLATFSLNR